MLSIWIIKAENALDGLDGRGGALDGKSRGGAGGSEEIVTGSAKTEVG